MGLPPSVLQVFMVFASPARSSAHTPSGTPPQPFIVVTALGAVTAFLTPIGHHGNLLILNPGQYTFGDFFRIGIPLTILISLVSAWLAQYLWLGGPLLPAWVP